ncbi:MAG: hypothetical protein R3A44_12780 [Caldilineaceae bacterium]
MYHHHVNRYTQHANTQHFKEPNQSNLHGKVALVAGSTLALVSGIACMLGAAGATVYCTGRSTRQQRSEMDRPETIEETAEMVTAHGGQGIWAQCTPHPAGGGGGAGGGIAEEQNGQPDILVNNISGRLEHSMGSQDIPRCLLGGLHVKGLPGRSSGQFATSSPATCVARLMVQIGGGSLSRSTATV